MSRKIELPDEILTEIIRMYNEEKLGTPTIGQRYGMAKNTVRNILKRAGITLDSQGRRNIGGKTASDKRHYEKNKDKRKVYHKEWSTTNRSTLRKNHSLWREANREHVNNYSKEYEKKRKASDPKYKLGALTRTAVWQCLKERNVSKNQSTFKLLGYTVEELMCHLEALFTEGMSWDNYGEWHVDHKKPMAKFHFTNTDDQVFKLCWSLENLQPLWGSDNLSKGSRYL